jgi:hypothetical protein
MHANARRTLIAVALLAVSAAPVAAANLTPEARFLQAVDRMIAALGADSLRASLAIRSAYRDHLELLVLNEYSALESALATGGLVPLPSQPERFNVRPRVDGAFPIAEKDLDRQANYLSARPATIGALLDVASRVQSGPIEITSLVRHSEYQDALRKTNTNAITSIPMHTMGLAFDIAIVNTPLATVFEIRDVLQKMQEAGDILFIAERKQLVFHVVPHPSRLGYFTDVYARALAQPSALHAELSSAPVEVLSPLVPGVTTEIIAIAPTDEYAEQWWAAADVAGDLAVEVMPPVIDREIQSSIVSRIAARCFAFVSGLLDSARTLIV